jgi:hypothetical protein
MPGEAGICPAGGDTFVLPDPADSDKKTLPQEGNLNADSVGEKLDNIRGFW